MRAARLERADGRIVCARCELAETAWTRMKGLLGRTGLEPEEGLLIRPANSVHTAFMRFPIDVVFLDGELRVLRVVSELPAWRAAGRRGARAVLELPAGTAARVGLDEGAELLLRT